MVDVDSLAQDARAGGAPGVVLARRDQGETAIGSAGTADIKSGAAMDAGHQFYVASIGKTFIAALVLGLVGDGRLGLDEPADAYLGDIGPIDARIRLRDLLQHTSGLRDFYAEPEFLEAAVEDPGRRWAVGDLLGLVLKAPSEPPGTSWSYATTNYLLLSLAIEHAGGSPAADQLQERLAEPLGLDNTHLGRAGADSLARGYMPADNPFLPGKKGLVDATELTPMLAYPDALVSTPADIARFLGALLDGTLLPPELRRELLAEVPANWDESDAYGLGIARISSFFGTSASPCGHAWGHLGLGAGHTTIALSREDGTRQVVLVANAGMLAEDAWHPLAEAAWSAFCGD